MMSYSWVVTSENARLAVLLRRAQWELDDVAHALPADSCSPEACERLAALLIELAGAVRAHGRPTAVLQGPGVIESASDGEAAGPSKGH